jgi:hypothetical protein
MPRSKMFSAAAQTSNLQKEELKMIARKERQRQARDAAWANRSP